MTDLFSLQGSTAVVTGAARGLGKAMAIGLAEAGADIILVLVQSPHRPAWLTD
jgi:NAD(P)-dependent dehydrogenase (short-subunit alcohol dehydrogenase family)